MGLYWYLKLSVQQTSTDVICWVMLDVVCNRFTVFSLLIHYVHRDGALGQQARDALLLCMVLSKNNEAIAEFIAHQSTVCPVNYALVYGFLHSTALLSLKNILHSST